MDSLLTIVYQKVQIDILKENTNIKHIILTQVLTYVVGSIKFFGGFDEISKIFISNSVVQTTSSNVLSFDSIT